MGIIDNEVKRTRHGKIRKEKDCKTRTVHQSGLLSGRIPESKPQYCRCGRTGHLYSGRNYRPYRGLYKIDYTPVFGNAMDLTRFGELGKKGVLALMCDSTNVMRPGFTSSEKTVGKTRVIIFLRKMRHTALSWQPLVECGQGAADYQFRMQVWT